MPTNETSTDEQYAERQPYRDAISTYLRQEDSPPNYMKIVYDLAPEFDVDPNAYDSEERKRFQSVALLALDDLIDVEGLVEFSRPYNRPVLMLRF